MSPGPLKEPLPALGNHEPTLGRPSPLGKDDWLERLDEYGSCCWGLWICEVLSCSQRIPKSKICLTHVMCVCLVIYIYPMYIYIYIYNNIYVYIIHYYLHISTHSTCDLEKVSQFVPSLGMMSLQFGLWTWSTVIKQDLTKSLSCNRVSGMASMSNPSGCPQANFCTFVPVHQIPCLGFQAIWCHSQGKMIEKLYKL